MRILLTLAIVLTLTTLCASAQLAPTVQQFTSLYRANASVFNSMLLKKGFSPKGENKLHNPRTGESIYYRQGNELMYLTTSKPKQQAIVGSFTRYVGLKANDAVDFSNPFEGFGDITEMPVFYSGKSPQRLKAGRAPQ